MDPKRVILSGLLALSVLALVAWADRPAGPRAAASGQTPPLALKPDLAIGVEDGDENLMFGQISRVDLDGRGNIYILDFKFRKIVVCDAAGKFLRVIAVPAGQGPREATNLSGIAVTPGGTLFVNDMQKVIVYGPDGRYLRTFLVDFMISSIGCAGAEELVAIGPNGGRILHVFDPTGKLLASFGDTFTPPGEFAPMKDMPMFGAPFLFNCAKDGRIFVLNPHKYEVAVFKDRKLERTLAGQSELFKPLQKMGRGVVSTAAHIVVSGDVVLVSFQNPDPSAKKIADIFQGGKQAGSMDLPGTPYNADAQGRIYFAETEPFPRVVRYAVVGN
jgi:6-bladed beta-propeller